MNSYQMVKQFHETFGHPAHVVPNDVNLNDPKLRKLRVLLIAHELLELAQGLAVDLDLSYQNSTMAHMTGKQLETVGVLDCTPVLGAKVDDVAVADAIGDLDVVVNGGALVFGFVLPAITAEIHRANMSKLGADGMPIYDALGKIQKGPNYRAPDVAGVLHAYRYAATFGEKPMYEDPAGLAARITEAANTPTLPGALPLAAEQQQGAFDPLERRTAAQYAADEHGDSSLLCKGTNCGSDGTKPHSPECQAEYDEAVGGDNERYPDGGPDDEQRGSPL